MNPPAGEPVVCTDGVFIHEQPLPVECKESTLIVSMLRIEGSDTCVNIVDRDDLTHDHKAMYKVTGTPLFDISLQK